LIVTEVNTVSSLPGLSRQSRSEGSAFPIGMPGTSPGMTIQLINLAQHALMMDARTSPRIIISVKT
jgi:hypothetical protein